MNHVYSYRRPRFSLFLSLAGVLIWCGSAFAQQFVGTITGTVQDSTGAAVPNAKVTLMNTVQAAVAGSITTNQDGTFVFTSLQASTYQLTVEANGFKKYVKSSIVLDVNQKIGLPPVVLEVGATQEEVTVQASAAQLDTVTAQRTGIVTGSQMVDLALNGRSFTNLMKTVAGVNADGTNNMNGSRSDQGSYSTDGVSVMDSGCGCTGGWRINVDAIAEFSLTDNSQSSEFGRSDGQNLSTIIKSGGSDFHGTGYWFHRNEDLNANTFTNNDSTPFVPRQLYRYMTAGYNVGGPLIIPKFNPWKNRNKLFFFIAQEWNRSKTPGALQQITVPTAAQRTGNFAGTQNGSNVPVTITDPQNGGAPFPGNVIPTSRLNQYGTQLLDVLPLPNVVGNPLYNYQSQFTTSTPQFDDIYRVDYNITNNEHFFFRLLRNSQNGVFPYGGLASGNVLGLSPITAETGAWSVAANLSTIITPTLTNEFIFGDSRNFLPYDPPGPNSPYLRKVSGVDVPLLYPNADPSGLIPNLGFGGTPEGTALSSGDYYSQFLGLPYANHNPIIDFTDNVTKVQGTHTIAAGFFIEHATKTQSPYGDVDGSFDFANDPNNPGNTGWAFANAAIGNFDTFTQINKYEVANYNYANYEFYVQDSWKIRSNLTLNYGIRASYMPPTYEQNDLISSFNPGLYNPAAAPVLYRPGLANGQRVAVNPLTGATLGAAFIGDEIPGVGNPLDGMLQAGQGGEPVGLMDTRGPQWGPRVGVAWSPFGANGKTVVRVGAGVFYERITGNEAYYEVTNPPVLQEASIYYGNLSNYTASGTTQAPLNVGGISRDGHLPTTYNYSFGIQQALTNSTLLDVSYVGSISRHLTEDVPFNDDAFGSAWLPQNQDPTLGAPKYNGTTSLSPNLYRPYIGYAGAVNSTNVDEGYLFEFGGTSSYNALQVSLNHRLSHGLQLGVAYTFSKALGIESTTIATPLNPVDPRSANYGPLTYDRPQNLVIDYIYNIPSPLPHGSAFDNPVTRNVLNNWQLSGITSISSGAPINVTYQYQTLSGVGLNQQITGSADVAPRPIFTCNPESGFNKSIYEFVNDKCFAPAQVGSTGRDSGYDALRGPGLDNWDIALFKEIPLGKEQARHLQLRVETFNTFNHTQWNTMNTNIIFSPTGQILNLPSALGGTGGRYGFGALNTVRSNESTQGASQRIVQLAIKLYF